LLASVGVSEVAILDFPSTAIISSGDELIPIEGKPEPHQIRRSNVYAIQSAMKEMKWHGTLHHMPDEKSILEASIRDLASRHDVLILSGGVSKGKFDFIPEVLESVGIKKKFHQVSQRPGKPFWFGVSDSGKVAFALPGNPVSTYMCFYRYIKPWAATSLGRSVNEIHAILAEDVSFSAPLTYFLQVRAVNEKGKLIAYPQAGGGSGDFANLKNVTGFLQLDLERAKFNAGEVFPYIAFR
jgi:molybdopterin molybdotransferase